MPTAPAAAQRRSVGRERAPHSKSQRENVRLRQPPTSSLCIPARVEVRELRMTLTRCCVAGSNTNSMKPSSPSRSQMSSRHSRKECSPLSIPPSPAPSTANGARLCDDDCITRQTRSEAVCMVAQKSAGRASKMLARACSWYPKVQRRRVKSCAQELQRWHVEARGLSRSKISGSQPLQLLGERNGRVARGAVSWSISCWRIEKCNFLLRFGKSHRNSSHLSVSEGEVYLSEFAVSCVRNKI